MKDEKKTKAQLIRELRQYRHEITEYERRKEVLNYRLQFEKLISNIRSDFINLPVEKIDDGISNALEGVARFAGAVRSSLFILHDNSTKITNTHEWRANPKESQISQFQGIPPETFGYYWELLQQHKDVIVRSLSDMPPEPSDERNWIKAYGFRPLLFVPMVFKGVLYGTLGFYGTVGEERDWSSDFISLLKVVADIFVGVLERKRSEETLSYERDLMQTLMQNTPDYIYYKDRNRRFVRASNSFCGLFGCTMEEIIGKIDEDFFPKNIAVRSAMDDRHVMETGLPIIEKEEGGDLVGGKELWSSTTKLPWYDEEGNIIGLFGISREITDRKMAEKAQRDSKERLLRAQRVARMGFLDWNLKTNEMYWSDEIYDLYGIERNGENVSLDLTMELVHPDDREFVEKNLEMAIQGVKEYDIDHRKLRRDGKVVWVHAQAQLVRDQEGKPESLLGTIVDITKRKQVEVALQKNEQRYRMLVETMNEGLATMDSNLRITYVNDRFCTMLGYSKNDLIGRLGTALHDRANQQILKSQFAARREGQKEPYEIVFTRKDGRKVFAHISPTAIFDENDCFKGSFATITDITVWKQVEEERASLAKFPSENPNPVLRVSKDGIILYSNVSSTPLLNLWQYHKGRPLSAPWHQFVKDALDSGLKHQTEVTCGETVFNLTFAPIVALGYVNVYALDITNLKKTENALRETEEKLRQSQKLEAIGRLTGGIAHDFNNLLTAILGYSEIIIADRNVDPTTCEYVQEIKTAAERTASLTQQLLAFSRKQILQPKVVHLNTILTNFGSMLRRLIGEDVKLHMRFTPELALIKVDPSQMEQVIMNLAVNSRDAMPQGGTLTIETQNISFDGIYKPHREIMQPAEYILITVGDTGHGMDVATMKQIFDPFFTTKEPGQGTGLGLSTTYGIIKQSGGYIFAQSVREQGTTFKIYLPSIDENERLGGDAPSRRQPKDGTESILLVEDEETVRRLVYKILVQRGYTVREAADGKKAIEIAKESRGFQIDLLITDVIMPGMSGRDVSHKLREMYPELKVLYISGYTDDVIAAHGVLEEGVSFIQKPFSPDDFVHKIRDVLHT